MRSIGKRQIMSIPNNKIKTGHQNNPDNKNQEMKEYIRGVGCGKRLGGGVHRGWKPTFGI